MASGVSSAPDLIRRAQDLILPVAIISSVLVITGAAAYRADGRDAGGQYHRVR